MRLGETDGYGTELLAETALGWEDLEEVWLGAVLLDCFLEDIGLELLDPAKLFLSFIFETKVFED